MSNRQDILAQITALANAHGISREEIARAMEDKSQVPSKVKSGNLAMKIFSIMGAIFVFSGISSYVGMFWNDMNSAMRVIITLGSGFVIYLISIIFFRQSRYPQAVAPLLLIAAVFESGGLFVLIDEFFSNNSNNWRLACLIVFGLMFMQQALSFFALRIPVLLLTSLWFGALFFATAFDKLNILPEWNAIIIGFSLLVISYNLSDSVYKRILQIIYLLGAGSFFCGMQLVFFKLNIPDLGKAAIGFSLLAIAYGAQKKLSHSVLMLSYICGMLCFLYGWFDTLNHTPFEALYIAVTCLTVYFSIIVQSTFLLIISVIAMLSYIGYFTAEHFVNSVGWPLALIMLGILFFIISSGALRIKKKYMS